MLSGSVSGASRGNPYCRTLRGEVRPRLRLELARAYDRDQYGDKRQVTGEITVAHTVGGIIDAVMGRTAPLVTFSQQVMLLKVTTPTFITMSPCHRYLMLTIYQIIRIFHFTMLII
jgi:hypothetical protein